MPTKRISTTAGSEQSDFAGQAQRPGSTAIGELIDFILHNKKWWLTPVIFVLLAAGVLVVLGGTAAAPFIYTLF